MAAKEFRVQAEVGYSSPVTPNQREWETYGYTVKAQSEFQALVKLGTILANDLGVTQTDPVRKVSVSWVGAESAW